MAAALHQGTPNDREPGKGERGLHGFTGAEITAGQKTFVQRGLQEYGSIVGHGSYLGPDYTADYLRRSSTFVLDALTASGVQDSHGALVTKMRTNRYDPATGSLVFTDLQISAFESVQKHYAEFFDTPTTRNGLIPSVITDPAANGCDRHWLIYQCMQDRARPCRRSVPRMTRASASA